MAITTADPMFMCVPAVHGPISRSFEEIRVDDYIKAFTTTGKQTPAPVPQEPTGDEARAQRGLLALFKPYTVRSVELGGVDSVPSVSVPSPVVARIVKPEEIPAAQVFSATRVEAEVFQSIGCMSGLSSFSHEELRYYAYLKGNIQPPYPIPFEPFQTSSTAVWTLPSDNTGSSVTSADKGETVISISAQPQFFLHSPEELRIAYLLAGREVTSQELIDAQIGPKPSIALSANPPNTLAPSLITTPIPLRTLPAASSPFSFRPSPF